MKKVSMILVILVMVSSFMVADTPTISKIKSGEAGYEAGCAAGRALGLNVCGELDKNGTLKPECNPKKVIPKTIINAAKKVIKKVKNAITKSK